MAKFRKKPVVIDAVQWKPELEPSAIPGWLWDEIGQRHDLVDEATGILVIRTDHPWREGRDIPVQARHLRGDLRSRLKRLPNEYPHWRFKTMIEISKSETADTH